MSLGVGILGAGMVAEYHRVSIAANGARLVAVGHHDPDKFAEISTRFAVPCLSFAAILEHPDIEVVIICTPSGQHAAQTIAAAKAGKHVLVEKPMALSLADADAMIKACQDADVQLGVVLQRRCEAVFKQVKVALEAGDLGKISLAAVTMPYLRTQAYYDQAAWRGTWALDGGGVLMNQGIHLLDLLLWFLGRPISITAKADTLQHTIEVEDTLVATLQFESGAMATFTATTTAAPGFPHRLEVYGSKGGIQILGEIVHSWSLSEPGRVQPLAPLNSEAGSGSDPRGIKPTGHIEVLKDFIAAIRDNRPPLITGFEGKRSLEVVLEIYKAAGLKASS